MKNLFIKIGGRILILFGIKKIRLRNILGDIYKNDEFMEIYNKCNKYTMTSIERMYELYKSVNYIVDNNISGDFVECGVWKGGSIMLIAYTLLNRGIKDKKIYLYDTFEGMTEPSEKDNLLFHKKINLKNELKTHKGIRCYSPLQEVKNNTSTTGYKNFIYIKGDVLKTIPNENTPLNICLLRLDTDRYESTYHELKHLYPKITNNGILLLDDYGWRKGARDATDEYFKENNIKILLNRIDNSGVVGIKTKL